MKMEDIYKQQNTTQPDTYEASMARNQLLKIGKYSTKIYKLLNDDQEMESWVAKKIDLATDYVKTVYGYTVGQKAGHYNEGDSLMGIKDPVIVVSDPNGKHLDKLKMSVAAQKYKFDPKVIRPQFQHQDKVKWNGMTLMAPISGQPMNADINEDAGEGHMSKSQLYTATKHSIELLEMIKPGDDLEAWVQTKLNLSADYLQAVYHYEDYQNLNPYREDLGDKHTAHAQIVQKNIDEILEIKTPIDDVETKSGMFNILKKRVHEFEKKYTREQKQNEDNMGFSDKEIKMAYGVLNNPKYKGGNMTGAVKVINKIAPGLADHPSVAKALQRTNEGDGRKKGIHGKGHPMRKKQQAAIHANEYADVKPRDAKHYKELSKSLQDLQADPNTSKDPELKKEIMRRMSTLRANKPTTENYMPPIGAGSKIGKAQAILSYGKQLADTVLSGDMDKAKVQADVYNGNYQDAYDGLGTALNPQESLDEGLKDWAKNLVAAGVVVAGLAGVGSINDAMNNSVPVVQAMNTAYEMANNAGHTDLAKQIEKDIQGVKLRLDTGKDLNQVKYMQDKYAKFMSVEAN